MLHRFALSLTGRESDALDLMQQTFYLWALRGGQLRDPSKVKSWLFTTLYREFLATRRRASRHPQVALELVQDDLPALTADVVDQVDATMASDALREVDEPYRVPLFMFYFEDCSYKDIAEMLGIPVGTVMSRIARGKEQLRRLLAVHVANPVPVARKEEQP